MAQRITKQSYANATIRLMERLIEEHAPNCRFSLRGYIDDGVCMERTDYGWLVYTGSRGNKDAVEDFADIKDACIEVIRRITDSYATEIMLTEKFKADIKALRTQYIEQNKRNHYANSHLTTHKQDGEIACEGVAIVQYPARPGEIPGIKGEKKKKDKTKPFKVNG